MFVHFGNVKLTSGLANPLLHGLVRQSSVLSVLSVWKSEAYVGALFEVFVY